MLTLQRKEQNIEAALPHSALPDTCNSNYIRLKGKRMSTC